ncbi:MAG: glycosyltransferase, partial [Acidimicrobiia bacterium]|nr:glycosyltransferase [Acidimicrobiia bacterium]
VPARDEAATLPALLDSLARLDPAPHEILVVDDDSTDDTAAVAIAHGAAVVTAPPLPAGWLGKPSACHLGAMVATGTHLLFLDADTVLAPDALGRLLAAAPDGLLSVQPHHDTVHAYEQLSAFPNLVSMMGGGAFAPWSSPRRPVAFGPCLLTSRSDYALAGGHASVRASVVEDIDLARRYASVGLPVRCARGGDTVRFRMYPNGLRALVDGWTKNLGLGAGRAPRLPALLAAWWVAACAAVGAGGVAGVARWLTGGRAPVAATILWAVVAAELGWCLRRVGSFRWWTSVAFVVPLTAFVALFIRSSVRVLLGRPATWRGRAVGARTS